MFSVIVPTFDRGPLLAAAIESVLAQTVADFECLIVDDAGTERVGDFPDPRVRVLRRQECGGPGPARNTGLEAARGRYVTFLDDDDTYEPGRLAVPLGALATSPVVVCWRNGGERVLDGDVGDVILDDLVPHLGQVSLWRKVAPRFDERFRASEDVAWWLAVARSLPVTTVSQVAYRYRSHQGVRHGLGPSVRAQSLQLLLELERAYFEDHPRAEAFQWRQIGLAEKRSGNMGRARRAFAKSLTTRPSLRSLWHLVRCWAEQWIAWVRSLRSASRLRPG